MSVEITPPAQLGFQRPLTRLITQSMTIHNPHPHPIAFKIKTTAPKQYCVRPNSGRVESGESVEIQVLLQPLTTEPPPHAKCKDKFLVQSAFITPDEEMRTLGEMWAQTESNNKSAISEQKIKCVYTLPEDGKQENGIQEEEEVGESRVMDESAIFHSPKQHPGHTQWTISLEKEFDPKSFRNGGFSYWETTQLPYVPPSPPQATTGRAIFAAAQSSPAPKANGTHEKTPSSPTTPTVKRDAAPSAPVPASAVPPSSVSAAEQQSSSRLPDLTAATIQGGSSGVSPTNAALEKGLDGATTDKQKLEIALAEIEKLRKQLGDASEPQVTGLRRRGGGSVAAQGGAETAVEKAKEVIQANQGVPLEVVVGLIIAVFVMTYLFF